MRKYCKAAKEGFLEPFRMLHMIVMAFTSIILGDPLKNQYQKIELAIKTKAQLVSDHEFNRVMENFYIDRCLAIDPHMDWWGFADAKEKQMEYNKQLARLAKKIQTAMAHVKAQEAAFEKMRNAR